MLGRFAQADSIVPGAGHPLAWDRYAYALNAPVNYTDPSGHVACNLLGATEDIEACSQSTAAGFNEYMANLEAPYAQMPEDLSTSEDGIDFLKSQEGFEGELYNDGCKYSDIECRYDLNGDGKGHCTIGYGHLVHTGPCNGAASEAEFSDGLTENQADALLRLDVQPAERAIYELVNVKLTQLQFDALVSLVFNWGRKPFSQSQKLILLNSGKYYETGKHFLEGPITSNGVRMPGLIRRRGLESQMFITVVFPE